MYCFQKIPCQIFFFSSPVATMPANLISPFEAIAAEIQGKDDTSFPSLSINESLHCLIHPAPIQNFPYTRERESYRGEYEYEYQAISRHPCHAASTMHAPDAVIALGSFSSTSTITNPKLSNRDSCKILEPTDYRGIQKHNVFPM